jgi:hypothetical protein
MSTKARNNILEAVVLQAKHDEYAKDPNHSCDMCEPEPRTFRIISVEVIHRKHDVRALTADDAKNQVLRGLDEGETLDPSPRSVESCFDTAAGRFV